LGIEKRQRGIEQGAEGKEIIFYSPFALCFPASSLLPKNNSINYWTNINK
jgi:hypothetical protein